VLRLLIMLFPPAVTIADSDAGLSHCSIMGYQADSHTKPNMPYLPDSSHMLHLP
jgi:hypothetical protein